MKQTRVLMGMPITVEIVDTNFNPILFTQVYDYFDYIDHKFSVYKSDSEITLINQGKIKPSSYSTDMKTVFALCHQTKEATSGYFDINRTGTTDPSGLVKGWAIFNAAQILKDAQVKNFYVDAGGDIQACGLNSQGQPWTVGIRHPFNTSQVVKVLALSNLGVATSGTYLRGQHVYNPKKHGQEITEIVSTTVVGPNIYEADRFATAAFAMGRLGVNFIESLPGLEAYVIDHQGLAIYTSGFNQFVSQVS